jgi:GNAT superfamily N-acetyltransferase
MTSPSLPTRRSSTAWERLRDGRTILIRPIEPSDNIALVAFHERLSDTTRRLRFFSPHPHLTNEEVTRFTNVDHDHRQALVAIFRERVIGVGRFDAVSPTAGEVAFVVADDCQGQGLGSLLLERLGAWAHDHGFTRFDADVLGGNGKMLHVFAHYAPERTSSFGDGIVHLDMAIPD